VFRRQRRALEELARVLHRLARFVGVEVHDVVGVHEAHEEAPGRTRVREGPPLAPQPGDRTARDQVVELVPAEVVADEVAGGGIIGKPVFLHLLREQPGRVVRIEILVQMPLALVRPVVADLAEHVTDRGNFG
jgi:hypothetical protein